MSRQPRSLVHPPTRVDAQDASFMRRALQLAERGRCTTAPNPWVGCVVVRDGRVVGEGYHRRAGEPHAETWALAAADTLAYGATAYVTLEPCAHIGRTAPCVDSLIQAGLARVVVAVLDPDPRVSGRGVERLRASGIQVDIGVGDAEAGASLAAYLHHRRTGRAYCLLKSAVSMDGRTSAADGSSRWITGSRARADAHRLRSQSQAVVVGAGTALADMPSLTVRNVPSALERQPLRVLLDARGRVPARGPLFDPTMAATLVITTVQADETIRSAWLAAGAEVAIVPAAPEGGVDLPFALRVLGERGVLQALIEGGATLAGAVMRAGLVNRLVMYVGGVVLGEMARPVLAGPGPCSIAEADRWRLVDVRKLGTDARLAFEPCRAAVGADLD